MELIDQVCSFELAKRLKKLGIKQESLFYWIKEVDPYIWYNPKNFNYPMTTVKWFYSAYTTAELGELIPVNITLDESHAPFENFRINLTKARLFETELKVNYLLNYKCDTTETAGEHAWLSRGLLEHNIYDTNLANAMAKMLIYLTENNLLKEQVK